MKHPLLASTLILLAVPAAAETVRTEAVALEAEAIADGLENPWGLDFLPDGGAIVTERPGRLRIFADGRLSDPVEGVPEVAASGQGGLLDVAVAPDFETSGLIYLSYSEPGEGGAGTAVARGQLVREGGPARLEGVETIFSMNQKSGTSRHFGSRLVFAPDGTLFVTTGDRGDGPRAQDFQDHAGAVLRIGPDGSVPADNPFANGQEALPEIWSKGHRNPQSADWDPVMGGLVVVEHGARGGDEVNYPEAGKNYGWPVISYGVDYSGARIGVGTERQGLEQPAHYWDPSIAPSGLVAYDGEMFPEWKGDLLVGALKFELLSRLDRDESGEIVGEERFLEGEFGRIRDVNQAPDGSIWLLNDESDGRIIRLSRAEDQDAG
ncbi:MAG TPA: PQQ-dependent sugar dehydrogenase [Mesorhizobium sp.]|jgi:glucose/arabinose dehydrogenase|nr:PQQ-dependent sugar dehydrogenase [Mesorhizobium sp.]